MAAAVNAPGVPRRTWLRLATNWRPSTMAAGDVRVATGRGGRVTGGCHQGWGFGHAVSLVGRPSLLSDPGGLHHPTLSAPFRGICMPDRP